MRLIGFLACVCVGAAGLCPAVASAERPATHAEFAEVDRYFTGMERSLQDRLAWVHVSTVGPFALAFLTGGQVSAVVMRREHGHWRAIDTISDEDLYCNKVPRRVIADLHLEKYNIGPKPCEPAE